MNTLTKLFASNMESNHDMKIKDALKHYIAQNSVQTYDRRIDFSANEAELEKMDFRTTIQELGYELSKEGKNWGLVGFKYKETFFIDFGRIHNFKRVGNVYTMVEVETGEFKVIDETKYPLLFRFELINGSAVRSEVYYYEKEMKLVTEGVDYEMDTIPVLPMKNNALGKGDLPEELNSLMDEYEYYGDQLGVEWEKIKTQFLNNLLFGSTKDAAEWSRDMQSGKDVHDVSDDDGRLQGAISPLISGSTTPNIIMQNLMFIEDKILKYAMQYRELGNTGTNKHNLEIAGQNQQAWEYMNSKIEFRQRQLNRFFELLGWDVKVLLSTPELEELKLLNMRAQINNIDAQSANQLGQAENQKAQAVAATMKPATEGE